jgi:hypothetical protein
MPIHCPNFSAWEADHYQPCRQAGESASPDHGDSRHRSTTEPISRSADERPGGDSDAAQA